MKIEIVASKPKGSIMIPPSKSMAHRAIICACLAEGTSTLINIDYSQDILASLNAMETLGAKIHKEDHQLNIQGVNNKISPNQLDINCFESGSTLRFLIPLFSLSDQPISFMGSERLLQRPQSIYQNLFDQQGLQFKQSNTSLQIQGSLKAQTFKLKGDVSSQFISGLLFALPLLNEDSIIEISEPFESRSYVDLTLDTLNTFGIQASFKDSNTLIIPGNQKYQACDYTIEGDDSQMAFFAVLGSFLGDIEVLGLNKHSKQGDRVIIDILKNMGAKIEDTETGYQFHASSLKGIEIDLSNCPDLGPILCVVGACATGETTIKNARRLRIKESDRILAMETELRKFGVGIHSTEDTIYIKNTMTKQKKLECDSHNDHRIAMSLSMLSLILQQNISLTNAECIHKSYPNFYEDLRKIGVQLYEYR
jgi:3-phosphoshikimate 1-carboxyvinyltransferase